MNEQRPPGPAATIVLLRDGPDGVEVFMQRRHGRSGFMAGATVFPGGKVDVADWNRQGSGRSEAECADALGLHDPAAGQAFFVAAIRELHEEAWVLLACDGAGRLPGSEQAETVRQELEQLRDGHHVDGARHHTLIAAANLTPALDRLVPFAHWVTPQIEPRRFDTRFFAALCPAGQEPGMDGHEMTHALWCRPKVALQSHLDGGEIVLPPPTLHTLERLSGLPGSAADVLAALAAAERGPCIEPLFVPDSDEGPIIVLPDDPLHPEYKATVAEQRRSPKRANRFVLSQGRFVRRHSADAL